MEQSLVLTQNELMRQSKKQRSSVLQRKIHGLREREIDREGSLPACFNRKHKEERERERERRDKMPRGKCGANRIILTSDTGPSVFFFWSGLVMSF